MKTIHITLLILVGLLFTNCGSNDDECTKTITIPQYYVVGNQTYSYESELEVPCDYIEPDEPQLIEAPMLENFTYEILSFNYTPDTGNNTLRLQFEIKLNNLNNYAVEGFPYITMRSDNIEYSTAAYSQFASDPCYGIAANSSCYLSVDIEDSLDLGQPTFFEILNVEYLLTN